jgi:hypothetical protein
MAHFLARLRSLLAAGVFSVTLFCFLIPQAVSQSINLNAPAPLKEGNNQALVDSFVGDHYYYFFAEPGKFHIGWSWSGANEGFDTGGKPSFAAAFNPKTVGAVMTRKETPGGVTYDGTVTQRTRVLLGVSPVNSKLVRQTTPYVVAATGNVSFGNAAAGPDAIVGMYAQKLMFGGEPAWGAVKFMPNGTIMTSNGVNGSWKLFDGDVYTVIIGSRRMTLTLQRGRALVDTTTKGTVLELTR